MGSNPAHKVRKRRVPKRLPAFLTPEEVPRLLAALPARWRPLFATAILTGLRKGELAGLHRDDVDLERRVLSVRRSYDRPMPKGGRAEAVAIHAELVPFLEAALATGAGPHLFPLDGGMIPRTYPIGRVLKGAMVRADLVAGWTHVCRRKGCGHREEDARPDLRPCPRCGMKLWPSPVHRPLRFHDLRHTAASNALMAGADLAAVQRQLRHSSPTITTGTYGHLTPGYLQAEVNKVSYGLPRAKLGACMVQAAAAGANPTANQKKNPLQKQGVSQVTPTGFEPMFSA